MTRRTGFAPQPTYILEIKDDRGKLADIPFVVEPIASSRKRAERAGAIAILIMLLMQKQTEENFKNLADAVGLESADAVRRLAIGAKLERFRCRLLDDRGDCVQALWSHRPEYTVNIGAPVSIGTIANLAKEGAA